VSQSRRRRLRHINRERMRVTRPYFAAVLALGLLTLLAFSNSFSTRFALDNQTLLLGESGLYRPLTTLSYLLNYAILGNCDHPSGYHWINFFLHTANVFLLFALLLRLMTGRVRALPAAFCIAMLWAVHQVLTESGRQHRRASRHAGRILRIADRNGGYHCG